MDWPDEKKERVRMVEATPQLARCFNTQSVRLIMIAMCRVSPFLSCCCASVSFYMEGGGGVGGLQRCFPWLAIRDDADRSVSIVYTGLKGTWALYTVVAERIITLLLHLKTSPAESQSKSPLAHLYFIMSISNL